MLTGRCSCIDGGPHRQGQVAQFSAPKTCSWRRQGGKESLEPPVAAGLFVPLWLETPASCLLTAAGSRLGSFAREMISWLVGVQGSLDCVLGSSYVRNNTYSLRIQVVQMAVNLRGPWCCVFLQL